MQKRCKSRGIDLHLGFINTRPHKEDYGRAKWRWKGRYKQPVSNPQRQCFYHSRA